jgi:hypothetical protein
VTRGYPHITVARGTLVGVASGASALSLDDLAVLARGVTHCCEEQLRIVEKWDRVALICPGCRVAAIRGLDRSAAVEVSQ